MMANSQSSSDRFPKLKLAILTGITFGLVAALFAKYQVDISNLKSNFQKEKDSEIESAKLVVEEKMRYIYQTIRTMSFIPGVRKIDRYAKKFDSDSKMAVQQLYNNAFLNIKLSEVYILPKSLDPTKIDPNTKKPEEPITTFDELVLSDTFADKAEEKKPEIEEVEEFEYRLMKTQLEFFATKFAQRSSFKDLDVPVVSGPEVVTCDNSEFTMKDLKSGNDAPRKGLVFTVPVYNHAGEFNGGVSAVVRTNVIRELLPKQGFALVNTANNYLITQDDSSSFKSSIAYFEKGSPDTTKLSSKIVDLGINDSTKWKMWVAFDDEAFWSLPEVKKTWNLFVWSNSLLCLLMLIIGFFLTKEHRISNEMKKMIAMLADQSRSTKALSSDLTESAHEMNGGIQQQTSAAQETAASMEEITAMLKQTSSNAEMLSSLSIEASSSSETGISLINEVVNSAKTLESFAEKTGENMENLRRGLEGISKFIEEISQKTKVINEIVFQTKLLSFNASVEAARAGEFGKGFSVVAEEVGSLAKMSGNAAAEIMETLDSGTHQIESLLEQNNKTIQAFLSENTSLIEKVIEAAELCNKSFSNIHQKVVSVSRMSGEITNATVEQSRGVDEANKAVALISNSAHENSTEIESVLKAMENLSAQASEMDMALRKISEIMHLERQNKISANSKVLNIPLDKEFEKSRSA